MRNAYAAIGRLSTHPAFSWPTGRLYCAYCGQAYTSVKEFETHFLSHGPEWLDMEANLSGRMFDRIVAQVFGKAHRKGGEP